MHAALPMYDLLELRPATDALWARVAQVLRDAGELGVPDALCRDQKSLDEIWLLPDLLLAQTCGYPLTHRLKGRVTYVATPVLKAPGCSGSNYCSVIITHADEKRCKLADFAGARAVYNSGESQSGMNALRSEIAPLAGGRPFFSQVVVSGSHAGSLAAVADGKADIATIDCVTYALIAKHRPDTVERLKVFGYTPPAPALPYITRASATVEQVERLRWALLRAAADPTLAEQRDSLLIEGIEVRPETDYERIVEMESAAQALGYSEIR